MSRFIYGYNPKNDLFGYKTRRTDDVNVLFSDLARNVVTGVSIFADQEMTNVITGETWISNSYRNNANIKERGNIALIDFEGTKEKFEKLIKCMRDKNLFFLAVPSQNNKSKKETRYHIVYLLSIPFSINSQSMKHQAKEFFKFIGYRWDEPDSGIDVGATLGASRYFSPTIPLSNDKKSNGKVISNPYIDLDDVFKDSFKNEGDNYTPTVPDDDTADEMFDITTVRGRRIRGDINTKIIRTTKKGYVLSPDTHIMTGSTDRFVTFEKLVETLEDIKKDDNNPRISGLGCPICNPAHTETKPGYAYMQYDTNGKPYICCTGNACKDRPYYSMAEGGITVYRIVDNAGVVKYIMLEDDFMIYTHKRDMTYKMNPDAVADELYNRGLGKVDENGFYSRAITINEYCVGAEALEIHNNPFIDEGLDLKNMVYNISPAARFDPKVEKPNDIVKEAIKAFDNDIMINGYPISLVYIAYYMFHYKQIMAVLFLVNADRGSGKSFWVLDLPTWYLGHNKVSGMGSAAIIAGWDDEKDGRRLVVYEDVENLNKRELGILRGEIKSDATSGSSKILNIKGQGKKRSFGFNSAGTTNHLNQIPFDGEGDRRIYPAPYKKIEKSTWLVNKFIDNTNEGISNRTNAINYLYSIYKDCETNMNDKLWDALYYKVPISPIKDKVQDSNSSDGVVAMNIIRRSKKMRIAFKQLIDIVHIDIDEDDLKDLLSEIEWTEEDVRIPSNILKDLWKILPSGKDSMKSYSNRQILNIFGIEEQIKPVRINKAVKKGVTLIRKQ